MLGRSLRTAVLRLALSVLVGPSPALWSAEVAEASAGTPGGTAGAGEPLPELTTKDGRIYRECRILRAEPDALLVRHAAGVARLSLFDLPEPIQQQYRFDPSTAMAHARSRLERERDQRWRLFWERQEFESGQARIAEHESIQRVGEREWVPVEARIVQHLDESAALARCRRVTFEKTQVKSTLGFLVDGPPRRVLVDFAQKAVVLRFAVPLEGRPAVGTVWKGFVNPAADGETTFRYRGVEQSAPAHRAVPAR